MNRLENSIQLTHTNNNNNTNNQIQSAFSVVSNSQNAGQIPSPSSLSKRPSSFLNDFFHSIDWKTVAIAVLWPFIIRLVFFFIKKVRLVM